MSRYSEAFKKTIEFHNDTISHLTSEEEQVLQSITNMNIDEKYLTQHFKILPANLTSAELAEDKIFFNHHPYH